MALLDEWQDYAEAQGPTREAAQNFWARYFNKERDMYALLLDSDEVWEGTVQELADRFKVDLKTMTGFLDGINDSLKAPNPIETMDADRMVRVVYDMELLYKNMVEATADWLYKLPQWDRLLTAERRQELYKEQKSSHTVRRATPKVGRNDPCPCGSGKQYKFCCGR